MVNKLTVIGGSVPDVEQIISENITLRTQLYSRLLDYSTESDSVLAYLKNKELVLSTLKGHSLVIEKPIGSVDLVKELIDLIQPKHVEFHQFAPEQLAQVQGILDFYPNEVFQQNETIYFLDDFDPSLPGGQNIRLRTKINRARRDGLRFVKYESGHLTNSEAVLDTWLECLINSYKNNSDLRSQVMFIGKSPEIEIEKLRTEVRESIWRKLRGDTPKWMEIYLVSDRSGEIIAIDGFYLVGSFGCLQFRIHNYQHRYAPLYLDFCVMSLMKGMGVRRIDAGYDEGPQSLMDYKKQLGNLISVDHRTAFLEFK